ncbi:MAG: hypothetical protein JW917_03495 [Ignavibacteria bacterium]|nr:hypothetical protein [Ignavibacteria bacterium]
MKIKLLVLLILLITVSAAFLSCSDPAKVITQLLENKVTAKERLDSANAQAIRKYGDSTKLVLVLGQNVLFEGLDKGKTDISIISALSDPNSLGAWIYVFKKPGTDTLAVYTPNPTPGASDCIELTKIFNLNTLLGLIADTSARNIVSGALALINNSNFNITTSTNQLVDSDVSLDFANTSNPIIKFNSSFVPSSSTQNGNYFFTNNVSGATKTVNMFLMPALGTLNLPAYITSLTGFPNDLWVVNYKKNFVSTTENLILGTVVTSSQQMGIPYLTLISRVINLSKFVNE